MEVFILKKHIFWVINKEKLYAYVVSVCTIVALFFMSNLMNVSFGEIEETTSNITENITENNYNINNTTKDENINNNISYNNNSIN